MAQDLSSEHLAQEFARKRQALANHGNLSLKKLEDAFHNRTSGVYLADFIFGANDGLVTTFAVVAGSVGANLPSSVVIILGFANLFADSLSMGLGNYLGQSSEHEFEKGLRRKELWEIERFPAIERQEIREIFAEWGFRDADLDRAVAIVSQDKNAWVNLMMAHELGVNEAAAAGTPFKHGMVILTAFITAGFIPIVPFLLMPSGDKTAIIAAVLAGLAMFAIGAFRSRITPLPWAKAGFQMLLVGGIASGVAYVVGEALSRAFGLR